MVPDVVTLFKTLEQVKFGTYSINRIRIVNYDSSTEDVPKCDHFGPGQSDDINRMISILSDFYFVIFNKLGAKM